MRLLLIVLVILTAFTATVSGIMLIMDPRGEGLGLTLGLLERSPFEDYLLPGILLAVIVGSSGLVALLFLLRKHRKQYTISLFHGAVLIIWLLAQVFIIQSFHWLHWIFLFLGIFIILLANQLKGKWLV